MPLCENCNETSPSPVSTVTINQTLITVGDGTGTLSEDPITSTGTASYTLSNTYAQVLGVYVGGLRQAETNYTIVGTTLTWVGTAPAAGVKILVVGIVEV